MTTEMMVISRIVPLDFVSEHTPNNFPGGPAVKTALPLQRVQGLTPHQGTSSHKPLLHATTKIEDPMCSN